MAKKKPKPPSQYTLDAAREDLSAIKDDAEQTAAARIRAIQELMKLDGVVVDEDQFEELQRKSPAELEKLISRHVVPFVMDHFAEADA